MSETMRANRCDDPGAMAIHTRKITDSCRDKDCIEDLRVYLTKGSQCLLDTALQRQGPLRRADDHLHRRGAGGLRPEPLLH